MDRITLEYAQYFVVFEIHRETMNDYITLINYVVAEKQQEKNTFRCDRN